MVKVILIALLLSLLLMTFNLSCWAKEESEDKKDEGYKLKKEDKRSQLISIIIIIIIAIIVK